MVVHVILWNKRKLIQKWISIYPRAEGLAAEIKELQGQLADYNTVRKSFFSLKLYSYMYFKTVHPYM